MQAFEDLELDHLVGRPDYDIASCDFDSRIANLEALPPSCRELHANIELIIVPHLTTRALPCTGVTYCLDNPGSGSGQALNRVRNRIPHHRAASSRGVGYLFATDNIARIAS